METTYLCLSLLTLMIGNPDFVEQALQLVDARIEPVWVHGWQRARLPVVTSVLGHVGDRGMRGGNVLRRQE